jgi:hypothetical protein
MRNFAFVLIDVKGQRTIFWASLIKYTYVNVCLDVFVKTDVQR